MPTGGSGGSGYSSGSSRRVHHHHVAAAAVATGIAPLGAPQYNTRYHRPPKTPYQQAKGRADGGCWCQVILVIIASVIACVLASSWAGASRSFDLNLGEQVTFQIPHDWMKHDKITVYDNCQGCANIVPTVSMPQTDSWFQRRWTSPHIRKEKTKYQYWYFNVRKGSVFTAKMLSANNMGMRLFEGPSMSAVSVSNLAKTVMMHDMGPYSITASQDGVLGVVLAVPDSYGYGTGQVDITVDYAISNLDRLSVTDRKGCSSAKPCSIDEIDERNSFWTFECPQEIGKLRGRGGDDYIKVTVQSEEAAAAANEYYKWIGAGGASMIVLVLLVWKRKRAQVEDEFSGHESSTAKTD